MPKPDASTILVVASLVAIVAAADAPYFGTWKLNPAKSDFGPFTMTFSHTGDEWHRKQSDGKSYTFKMDGKPYAAEAGDTEAWKQLGPKTWEVTDGLNGKVVASDTYSLSPDGRTLTVTSKPTDPNGRGL